MPEHILRHSLMVRRVAVLIGSLLNRSGYKIDQALVDRASLLHDICKMDCIGKANDHALMGRDLLCRKGYPLVGEVVGRHVRLVSFDVGEAMVVNYADKRVMHDRIVSLSRRFMDLLARYGTDEKRRERIWLHYQMSIQVQDIISMCLNVNLKGLIDLTLVPCDQTLYGG